MSDLVKNKKRAIRRKRNLIARDLRQNRLYHEKAIGLKKVKRRRKINPRNLEEEMENDYE